MSGAKIRTGAWMNRGTIISLKPLQMMPTFVRSTESNPMFASLLARYVSQFGIKLPHNSAEGNYSQYSGDLSVSDKGEILVWQAAGN
jgi:formylmethanofuran dehydrogenase subunit C